MKVHTHQLQVPTLRVHTHLAEGTECNKIARYVVNACTHEHAQEATVSMMCLASLSASDGIATDDEHRTGKLRQRQQNFQFHLWRQTCIGTATKGSWSFHPSLQTCAYFCTPLKICHATKHVKRGALRSAIDMMNLVLAHAC